MKIWIIVICLISFCSCNEPEPKLYAGSAKVFATDGEMSDSLKTCYCWQTKDSLSLYITRGPFMGIAVKVIAKNNSHSTSLEYYSDTNEFDGEFTLPVPIIEDSLVVTYQTISDSIRISGYFDINSEAVKFYGDGRSIQTFGTFNCTMKSE